MTTHRVNDYCRYVQLSAVQPNGVLIDIEYNIQTLTDNELLELHKRIANEPRTDLMVMHLFDLENEIFRRVYKDSSKASLYCSPLLNDKIEQVVRRRERSIFHATNSNQIKTISDLVIQGQPTPDEANRPIKVVYLSLENGRNPIGGVGGVVTGLMAAHQKLRRKSDQAAKVFALYPLYSTDKLKGSHFEFQGIIAHQYEGQIVESSIYKNKKEQEYVIEPDPRFRHLFNIPQVDGVYRTTSISHLPDRILYLGSASAAFASLYRGKKGDKSIDVLKFDATSIAGCAFPLLDGTYDAVRGSVGLKRVKRVVVWHDGRLEWSEPYSVGRLRKLGIEVKNALFIQDLMGSAIQFADRVVFVGPNAASRALSPDPVVNMNRRSLLIDSPDKVVAIRNAAKTEQFDVTNRETFGSLALTRTFDQQGVETTDYVNYRATLKKTLHAQGFIADPTLPLVVFVGRYSKEKGIDVLVEMVKASKDLGIQFVVMGCEIYEKRLVEQLQEMEKTTHKDCLRVYTTMEEQRKAVGPVKMAQAVRGAADLYTMPSHVEGLPLAAMEGQVPGSLFIAPYHLGFVDICQPEGFDNGQGGVFSLERDANAICYRDHQSSTQAIEALKQAVNTWKGMKSDEERNQLARRLRNSAVSNFSWYHENPETNAVTGQVVRYQKLYEDLVPQSALPIGKVELVVPQQTPIRPLMTTPKATSLRERIKQIFLRFSLCVKRCVESLAVSWIYFYQKIRNRISNKQIKTEIRKSS